jgi:hypothetical protein
MSKKIHLVWFCLLGLTWCACKEANSSQPPPQQTTTATTRSKASASIIALPANRPRKLPATLLVKPLPRTFIRGACYAHNWQYGGLKGYGSSASLSSKKELKQMGIGWVSLTPFGWQRDLTSTQIHYRTAFGAGETDSRLLREIKQARRLKMKVMVKPHIWISYSKWRGHIKPAGKDGWKRWFASYEKFILHYARLSQKAKADSFVFGVELVTASKRNRTLWLTLIQKLRKVFKGKLVYAANWDEVFHVVFWDKVDVIGVQFFAPLSKQLQPTYSDLVKGVKGHFARYRKVSRKYKKPVVLTEVGYRSTAFSWINPAAWPEHLKPSERRFEQVGQAAAYAAVMEVARSADFLQGLFIWKWFTDVNTREEGRVGFSPRKKLAQKVLRAAFK